MHRIESFTRFAALLLCAIPVLADVKLASPFTDHMVLQRQMMTPIWGTADPGEEVTVEFAGQRKSVKAGNDGKWRVHLDPMTASAEGRNLTVTGARQSAAVSRAIPFR